MTIISSTTVPILDSAGRPANGRVYIEQSNRYESTAGLVTTTRGWARVTNGVIQSQAGGQLDIPPTPADQVVWFHEDFAGGTGVVRWATVVPDTAEVGYSDLPETVPPAAGTGVPAWVSDVLTAVDDAETAAASAVAAAAAAEAVGTTNDTIISGRIDDTGSATRASLNATFAALDGNGFVPRAKVLNESYDVRRSGVAIGSGSAQTTALAAAVDVVSAAGGGRLFIPEGLVYGQIALKSNVVLIGSGRDATTLKLPSGVTGPVISLTDTSQHSIGIHDLTVDGNRYSSGAGHGIHIAAGDHNRLSNIRVQNSSLDNVRFDGGANAGSNDIRDIFSYAAGQYGFYFNIADSSFYHLDTGRAGKYGIYDATANSYWNACKAWYSGEVDGSAGWYMFGANRNVYVNCITQDNKGPGFWLESATRNQLNGVQADSNGAGNSILAGFYLNGSTVQDNDISGVAFYRSDHGDATWHVGPQRYALQASGTPTGNRIRLRNALAAGVSGSAAQGTVPVNNDIEIYVSGGTGQTPVVRRGIAAAQGNTASRPASPVIGQSYFDTTLVKPIWYDGTNWKDATGATV